MQKVSILCNFVEDFKSVFHLAKESENSNFLKILGAHGVRANALGNAFAYVRFSMYNTHDGPVEGARAAGGKCGWTKAQPLPAGRTGRVVPVSQFVEVPALARGAGAFSVLVKFLENAVYFV